MNFHNLGGLFCRLCWRLFHFLVYNKKKLISNILEIELFLITNYYKNYHFVTNNISFTTFPAWSSKIDPKTAMYRTGATKQECNRNRGGGQGGGGTGIEGAESGVEGAESGVEGAESGVEGAGSGSRGGGKRGN